MWLSDFKKVKDKCSFSLFFKCTVSSEALTATLLSSQWQLFCFEGLSLLAVICIFYPHHWQINAILCMSKRVIGSLEGALEVQGSKEHDRGLFKKTPTNPGVIPWDGEEPTLSWETCLNIQQLKWPSLNLLLRTQSHLGHLRQPRPRT